MYQGFPDNPGDTQVTSMMEMFQKCLFYYYGLKLFRDKIKSDLEEFYGPNIKHGDKNFVTVFDAILKR